MANNSTGTNGNDRLDQAGASGPGTIVGLAGGDSIVTSSGLVTVTGDAGNDTVVLQADNIGTVSGGSDNDCIVSAGGVGSMVVFGNTGADTIDTAASSADQI